MDIEARSRFVQMLKKLVQEKHSSIILTSHRLAGIAVNLTIQELLSIYFSITECEAVCNRIGILIKGEFRCIGSSEDLKAK